MGYRAAVLGGGGRIGGAAVRGFAAAPGCDAIVVGDSNADRTARRLGGVTKITDIRAVDLADHAELKRFLRDVDVVVNAVGPYYRFAALALEGAISAGTHYVDVCDDIDPTLAMLDLDGAARRAGILAVVGCGTSPGFTNIAAAYSAQQLDELREVHMSWVVPLGDGGGPGAGFHSLHICARPSVVVEGGSLAEARSLGRNRWVEMPPPFGTVQVFDLAHPEALTLKRTFPRLREARNQGAILPGWEMERMQRWVELGLARREPLKTRAGEVDRGEIALRLDAEWRAEHPDVDLGPATSCIRTDSTGVKDGQMITLTHILIVPMALGTGYAAVVGAEAIFQGWVHRPSGVVAPEAALKPQAFFETYADLGIEVLQQDLTPVVSATPAALAATEA